MRKLTFVLMLSLSWPAMAAPIIYDLEYEVRSATPGSVVGGISGGDIFHVNLAWDWEAALGAPDADNRFISTSLVSYNTSFGNFSFTDSTPSNVLYIRDSGATSTRVEDWEPDCRFVQGAMAGSDCLSTGLLVDEINFGFSCADWSSSTHVLPGLGCGSGLTGVFGFGIRDVAGLGRDGGFLADLRSATDVPEPASWTLAAGGAVALLMFGRRRRQLEIRSDAP